MAKYFSDGTVLGAVYEEGDRFHYDCEHCSYQVSGGDEIRIERMADEHNTEHQPERRN